MNFDEEINSILKNAQINESDSSDYVDEYLFNVISKDPKIYIQGRDEIDDGQEIDSEKIINAIDYISNTYNSSWKSSMKAYSKLSGMDYNDIKEIWEMRGDYDKNFPENYGKRFVKRNINKDIEECLKNAGVQLNEEQSDEFLLVQKIIRKITELKKCFDEISEDEDILHIASEIYNLIDELPSFDEVQRKMHNINDWFYNAIEPLVKRDYPGDNYAMVNEPFNEFFQYYPKPAKMYAKMLVNYLPRLEQLFKQDYLEDDEYDGGEEELDESYLIENEVGLDDLDDIEQQIINAINEYESCDEKSKKIDILSQLCNICKESSYYDEPAIDFDQYLLDRALEDEDNMVYSTPSANEVDLDKVIDEFYNELSDNTSNIIERYSNYTVKGLMEEIEEYCKNYLNDIDDEDEESTIDDEDNIDTLDENYDQNDTDDNIREIYEKLSEYSYNHMRDEEINEIIRMCENSGYDELNDFIINEIDTMRNSYIDDSDNWGKQYDGDATYQKCVDMSLVDKICAYANSYEIERFINSIKKEIENTTGYSFDNQKQTNIQGYDGSEEELDESVKSQWNYKVGDEVIKKTSGKIWTISRIEPKWIFIKIFYPGSGMVGDCIYREDFPEEFEPIDKISITDTFYDGSEEELDESASPSWHYEVGDRVVEKGGDIVWVIRYIEKYDIGLRRYAYGGVMTTSCPKDQFEENYELLEQRDSKYMNYEGDDTEIDESVNKESTPFDKMMKLHKEHPEIDIRTVANKIANGNIEEYISLMKQFYEKFEK